MRCVVLLAVLALFGTAIAAALGSTAQENESSLGSYTQDFPETHTNEVEDLKNNILDVPGGPVSSLDILTDLTAPITDRLYPETPIDDVDSTPEDYKMLVDYSAFASFSYCIKRGLGAGFLGSQVGCPLEACKALAYLEVEILHMFNLNAQGEIGAGYYAIDHKKKRIILAFRGTASTIDWAGNLNAFLVDYVPVVYANGMGGVDCPGCKVHKGFYDFVKNNCADVIRRVSELKEEQPNYQLVVVGHSLGGALTVLTGIELQLLGHLPLVISFASPKVGNRELASFIDAIGDTDRLTTEIMETQSFTCGFVRVVHTGDIVPLLPPGPFYQHGGFEYFINKRELPHSPLSLERLGPSMSLESIHMPKPAKMWPDFLGKYEHKNYFRRVPGCDEAKET